MSISDIMRRDRAAMMNGMSGLDQSNHSVMSVNNPPASLEGFGENLFKGAVAGPYLMREGLAANTLESVAWTVDGSADKVRGNRFIKAPIELECLLVRSQKSEVR